jgi:hypothetical protein
VGDLLGFDPVPLSDGLDIRAEDWHQTSRSVRQHFLALLKRVEALEARVNRDSSNSSSPPSTDSPAKKRQRRTTATERHQPGAKLGYPGPHQALLEPTASVSLLPDACACGSRGWLEVALYHTHQVIEFPVIRPEMTHGIRSKVGACRAAREAKRHCPPSTRADMARDCPALLESEQGWSGPAAVQCMTYAPRC